MALARGPRSRHDLTPGGSRRERLTTRGLSSSPHCGPEDKTRPALVSTALAAMSATRAATVSMGCAAMLTGSAPARSDCGANARATPSSRSSLSLRPALRNPY